jgi:hypothetical protein
MPRVPSAGAASGADSRFLNWSSTGRIAFTSCAGARSGPSAFRRRWTARACSCETRDSFTPISAPICFIVTSP